MMVTIYDESGFPIGEAGDIVDTKNLTIEYTYNYKYMEDQIIYDFHEYINKTYQEHYKTEDKGIECFDAWIALGNSSTSFRDTAMKYLWRYGKKKGLNKDDLFKVIHYALMMLYVDHYKKGD